jgi:hypothetical protein
MYSIDHHDLGTPEASGAPIHLEIDGRPVTVPAGTSIMRAAALTCCVVPKLCALRSLHSRSGGLCVAGVLSEGRGSQPRMLREPQDGGPGGWGLFQGHGYELPSPRRDPRRKTGGVISDGTDGTFSISL